MLRNNFQSILRGFKKNKVYTTFNILGLSTGFACVLYIGLYIYHETTYDQFLQDYDQIFRISDQSYALTSPAHMEYLQENLSEIEYHAFLLNSGNFLIEAGDSKIIERKAFYVSPDFFKIFPHKIIAGSYENFNEISNAAVITESLAQKVFGSNPSLGEEVVIYQGEEAYPYKVVAVIADLPSNTHMSFTMLAHMPSTVLNSNRDNWGYTIYHGYFRTKKKHSAEEIQAISNRIFAQRALDNGSYEGVNNTEDLIASGRFRGQLIRRVDEIHFQSNLNFDLLAGGDIQYLWIFGGTAIFILLLASINFVNLTTAQSARRAKEVGIRKTLGSSRSLLISKILIESVVLCLVAALIAFGMAEVLITFMKSFLGITFSFSLIDQPQFILLLFGMAIFTGLLGGAYPSLYLTSYSPIKVLKGGLPINNGKASLRNVLVVFQFTVSLVLGILMFIIQDQVNYSLQKDPGFKRENLITIDNSLAQLGYGAEAFKNNLINRSEFKRAGYFHFDLFGMSTTFVSPVELEQEVNPFRVYYQWVGVDYLQTIDVQLISGRGFSPEVVGDTAVLIINETARRNLGFDDPVGKYVNFGGSPGQFRIIGVVKDFHHQSFKKEVPPTLFVYSDKVENSMMIRLAEGNVGKSIEALNKVWKQHTDQPLDYHFVDEEFAHLFEKEQQLSKIMKVFTVLAFFVACLGLLGLAGFITEQKTKEIGIRKALGATVNQIVMMFSKRFSRLILIAMMVATPLAYYLTGLWLESYVYRIDISFLPFLLMGTIALCMVLMTIGYHSIKAALANPVKALKDE